MTSKLSQPVSHSSLLLLFNLFAVFRDCRRILENVGGEPVGRLDTGMGTTRLAVHEDIIRLWLDDQLRLWIQTVATKHEFLDENIEQLSQPFLGVSTIDNVTLLCSVASDERAQLNSKEFCRVVWRTVQRLCNILHVGNDGFDSVTSAFNLGDQLRGQQGGGGGRQGGSEREQFC